MFDSPEVIMMANEVNFKAYSVPGIYVMKVRTNNCPTSLKHNRNKSKGLQIYWHQSEGIRPPFNRVDSVLLELPYDGLTDWLPCRTFLHFDIILTIFYSAIASPGQTIWHFRAPNYLAI